MRTCAILAIAMGLAGQAEVIDRIAVSVGNQVITSDQIADEIRVTAFLNRSPVDLSAAEKKKAADRLIEQTLIRHEIDFSHYPVPAIEEADPLLKKVESEYGESRKFEEALSKYGITENDLRQHLWWQITLLKFVDERFRPSVHISDAELRDFYTDQVAKWKQQGVSPIASFEDSRAKLEEILTQQRVDQALDRWLGDARTQVDIRFRSEAFQ